MLEWRWNESKKLGRMGQITLTLFQASCLVPSMAAFTWHVQPVQWSFHQMTVSHSGYKKCLKLTGDGITEQCKSGYLICYECLLWIVKLLSGLVLQSFDLNIFGSNWKLKWKWKLIVCWIWSNKTMGGKPVCRQICYVATKMAEWERWLLSILMPNWIKKWNVSVADIHEMADKGESKYAVVSPPLSKTNCLTLRCQCVRVK